MNSPLFLSHTLHYPGPWQLHGSVAGPGGHPGCGDSCLVDREQGGQGIARRPNHDMYMYVLSFNVHSATFLI